MGPLKSIEVVDWLKEIRELAKHKRSLKEVVAQLREIDPSVTLSYEIHDHVVFTCAPDKREAIEAALGDYITWFRERE